MKKSRLIIAFLAMAIIAVSCAGKAGDAENSHPEHDYDALFQKVARNEVLTEEDIYAMIDYHNDAYFAMTELVEKERPGAMSYNRIERNFYNEKFPYLLQFTKALKSYRMREGMGDAMQEKYKEMIDNSMKPWLRRRELSEEAAAEKRQESASAVKMPSGGWLLRDSGVGPLKLGAEYSSLPASAEGLYSKLERSSEESAELYERGEQVASLILENGRIAGIMFVGGNIRVEVSGVKFGIGGDCDSLKERPGVKGEDYDDEATYGGIRFNGHDGEINEISIGKSF